LASSALLLFSRLGAGHVADEMHHGVAMGDVDIELVERVAAEVSEILLHLHFDIVPREVGAKLVAMGAEFVGNSREKNLDRHRRTPAIQSRGSLFHSFELRKTCLGKTGANRKSPRSRSRAASMLAGLSKRANCKASSPSSKFLILDRSGAG
jgi:hypothetical protein